MGRVLLATLVLINRRLRRRFMLDRLCALVLYQDVARPMFPVLPPLSVRMVLGMEEPPWGRSAPPRGAGAGLWER